MAKAPPCIFFIHCNYSAAFTEKGWTHVCPEHQASTSFYTTEAFGSPRKETLILSSELSPQVEELAQSKSQSLQ